MIAEKSSHPFSVESGFTVKASNVDSRGFLKEAAVLSWLTTLRNALWREDLKAYTPVLTTSRIAYPAPLSELSEIKGQSWISNLGEIQWTVQSNFYQNQRVVATAIQSGYCGRVKIFSCPPIPAEISQRFWQYQWSL